MARMLAIGLRPDLMPLELRGVRAISGLHSSDRVQRIPWGPACPGRCVDALQCNRSATKSRFIGVFERFEDMRVQILRAQSGAERLGVRVVRRLPGAAEVEPHILSMGPRIKGARSELRHPMFEAWATWITAGFR